MKALNNKIISSVQSFILHTSYGLSSHDSAGL